MCQEKFQWMYVSYACCKNIQKIILNVTRFHIELRKKNYYIKY